MITQAPRLGVPARSLNGVIRLFVGTLGFPLPRCSVLRVHGRNSGKLREVPLLIGHNRGSRYLVAPRGNTEWARNLAAAGWGELVRGRHVERITALEVEGAERVNATHGVFVRDIMTREVVMVSPDTPVDAALEIMDQGYFRHLPVVDRDGTLLGIVSVRDLVKHRIHMQQADVESLKAYVTRTYMH